MQSYDQTCGILSRPRTFAPFGGTLSVPTGAGLAGHSVPISLAACSDKL